MKKYNPAEIEPKWQKKWEERELFKARMDKGREKYYVLEMFPYPSGRLHMGHVRNYSIGDVIARYKWMQGFNVLHPMGWDAFGLPAENAAIKHKTHPAKWTFSNIDYMRTQLKRLGFSYDWDREVTTCTPDYYRWEQKIFNEMLEKGLAYKKTSLVNWCPTCNTVLANEQVIDGKCWRCKTPVELKELEQWFFKITDYAEELLEGTRKLEGGWPQEVLTMQRNWIGKSIGAEVNFPLEDGSGEIKIFTTRPDTLYGVTFMSLAPEHPLALELTRGTPYEKEVREFISRVRRENLKRKSQEDYEKEGVFTGKYAINPLNGRKVPIYVANFVLMEYGTGAIMAVPAHDQRDFEFAKKYDIPIVVVIQPEGEELDPEKMERAYEGPGRLVNSGPFDGMPNEEAKEAIVRYLEEKGIGKKTVSYRLRDWGISRQRYWGAPIPVVYCEKCGVVPVPDEELPVELPEDVDFTPEGGSPLAKKKEFVETTCPRCGGPARRETDTMDTFVESSWYFLRYTSPHYDRGPFDKEEAEYWMPVDQYIGGIEHAVMHLLYARFYTKVLRDLGYVDLDEPFSRLLTQGMVLKDGSKMDKSRGNIVEPNEIIEKYGADTARLFIMFAAPPEKSLEWSDTGVEGAFRFLNRVWKLVTENDDLTGMEFEKIDVSRLSRQEKETYRILNKTIKKVTEDIEEKHFNTAIAAIMEMVNHISQRLNEKDSLSDTEKMILGKALRDLVLMLAPFAPHIADELWSGIKGEESFTLLEKWPQYDPEGLVTDEVLVVVQVNGKLRARMMIPADAGEEEVKKLAFENENVKKYIEGKEIKKVIYVPGKLINIVV